VIGPATVIVARPGWFEQRRIQVTPPSMSWRTDGPGSFDTMVRGRDLHTAGYMLQGVADPLKGLWLWYDHPTAGPWGGVITRTDVDGSFVRITAEQFNVLLRKRRVPGSYTAVAVSPGSLALSFLTDAERNGDSFMLTGWTAEETGDVIDYEPRGGDLGDDVIPALANFGYQWRVRAWSMDERLFEFRQRLGEDKRGSVLLSEGRHLVRFNQTGDLWTVVNSLEGVPGDQDYRDSRGYQLDDEPSMRALGRRYEATIAYTGAVTRSTIIPQVKRDLERLRYPAEIAQADIADADLCWLRFREGDVVSVASETANYRGPMTVDIRTLDTRAGTLSIAGRLLVEEVT
jgi:hypothetical protein